MNNTQINVFWFVSMFLEDQFEFRSQIVFEIFSLAKHFEWDDTTYNISSTIVANMSSLLQYLLAEKKISVIKSREKEVSHNRKLHLIYPLLLR